MPVQPPFDFSASPGFVWNGVGALRVTALTDLHVAEKTEASTRKYFRSLFKLRDVVAELSPLAPHFTAVLGDWVDGNETSPEDAYTERVALTHLDELPGPRYGVIGNHDCYVPDSRKSSLVATYDLPNSYYTFATNGLRFIFLDAMIGLPERYETGSDEALEAEAARVAYFAERDGNPSFPLYGSASGNGAFGAAQLAWLVEWLAYASAEGEKVIIFSHTPCWPDTGAVTKNAWDADDMVAAVREYDDVVVAWISGHRHADDYHFDTASKAHFISLPALVEGSTRNYGLISFTAAGGIVVTGYGTTTSRTLTPFTP